MHPLEILNLISGRKSVVIMPAIRTKNILYITSTILHTYIYKDLLARNIKNVATWLGVISNLNSIKMFLKDKFVKITVCIIHIGLQFLLGS